MTRRLTQGDKRAAAAGRRRHRAGVPGARPLRFETLEARQMLSATTLSTTSTTSSGTPGALSPAQVAEETAIATSINTFALDLYAVLQQQAGTSNLVVSPLSLSAALAMAYAGANGETATQMAQVLDFSGDADATEQAFGTLLTDLNGATQGTKNTLSIADALWGQQGMQLLTPFMQTMQADFAGGLQTVDFKDDPGAAIQQINQWASQETQGMIQNVVTPAMVNAATRLVLANAVYFNGSWASAFDTSMTQNAAFTLATGGQEQVSMMNQTANFDYMNSDGFQVLDLPYAGGRFSMDVILPDAGTGAASLSVAQLPSNLTSWLGGLGQQQVIVSLPKFSIYNTLPLAGPLGQLGMTQAFSNTADFSGISTQTSLKISDVAQAATIDVSEAGTKAAAVTVVVMEPTTAISNNWMPQPIVFDANHPFLFLIRDDQSGAILFMGQEMAPPAPTAVSGSTGNSDPTPAPASLHGGHSLARWARSPARWAATIRLPSAGRPAGSTMFRPAKLRRHPAARRRPALQVPMGARALTSSSRRSTSRFSISTPASATSRSDASPPGSGTRAPRAVQL